MKKIPLTKGKFALVDDNWFETLNCYKWYASCGYARRWSKYKNGKRKEIHMSRVVLGIDNEDVKKYQCDHIDRNKLNNQANNLRMVSQSENMANKEKYRNNTSGFRGVSFNKATNKFRARIQQNGDGQYIGKYSDPKHAAVAYNEKALELFGKYAVLNEVY